MGTERRTLGNYKVGIMKEGWGETRTTKEVRECKEERKLIGYGQNLHLVKDLEKQ